MQHEPEPRVASADHPLLRVIDRLAHLLPAQGPISIFIHHNTLHAFEHLPFEEAVEHAAAVLGREPFLAEPRYREKLASGRILARDVDALLHAQLGATATAEVPGVGSRFGLWRALVLHGIPDAEGRELSWILEETDALSRFRTDVPAAARAATIGGLDDRAGEAHAVHRLWNACVEAVRRAIPETLRPPAPGRSSVDAAMRAADLMRAASRPLCRYLAARAHACWPLHQGSRGPESQLVYLEAALATFHMHAASTLDVREAIRLTDLWLVHLASPSALPR